MKIKTGFISNSSSSSFCIIGTEQKHYIHRLAEAEEFLFYGMAVDSLQEKKRGCEHPETSHKHCPECGSPLWEIFTAKPALDYLSYGYKEGNVVTFYGGEGPYYAGVDAKKLLEDLTLEQAKVCFRELVKDELGIDIPFQAIDLYYGEAGND